MHSTWKILGLLLLLSPAAGGKYLHLVGSYIATLIRYLADQEPGIFDCWFYETAEPGQSSILDYIITLNQAARIPQRILHSTKTTEVPRSPALLIVNYDRKYYDEIGQFLQSSFNRAMKVIVFYDSSIAGEFNHVMHYFANFQLYNTLYVRLDLIEIHQNQAFQHAGKTFYGGPPFWKLFQDPVKNLTGHTVHVSYTSNKAKTFKFLLKKSKNNGYYELLLNEVIPRLGGKIQYHGINCGDTLSSAECTQKLYYYSSTKMFDFCTITCTLSTVSNEYFLSSNIPSTLIVAAPKGRPFSAFEIFTTPFRQELWIALMVLFIVCILLMVLQPTQITNNLILQPICGFERREFHLVSPLEKTILITLTLIFFALLSAYEAKIIAFMTEFPHLRDPRTLEDLLQNNITIQQYGESWGKFMYEDDPQIEQLFSRSAPQGQHEIQWDSQDHALIGGRSFMQLALSHPNIYHPKTGRQRFFILNEFTLGMRILFMFCGWRNPIAPKIQLEEDRRFESGLYEFWMREKSRYEYGIRQSRYLFLDSVDVGIAELEPAWYALAIGLGLAWVTLGMEFVWKFATSKYLQVKNVVWKCNFQPAKVFDVTIVTLTRMLGFVVNYIILVTYFMKRLFENH